MNQKPELSKGSIIISEPYLTNLPDYIEKTFYKRSLVILTEHDDLGSNGFILNKPTDFNITEALEGFPSFNSILHFGGPVDTDTLFYVHTIGERLENSQKLTENIYWGGNYDQLKLLIDTKQVTPDMIRFYAGYSEWVPNQLKYEIDNKIWMLPTFNREIVFNEEPATLWSTVLKSMGGEYSLMANYPEDPSLN